VVRCARLQQLSAIGRTSVSIVLGFAQIGAHLVFFLHLGSGPDHTNNILALAFGVLIVFLVIAGSCWITANLASNMADLPIH